MDHGLDALFRPRSIAVIGASDSPGKAGSAMMRSLSGFPGPVHPVNPRGGTIAGRPAYPSVAEIGAPVDLAVLVIPPAAVPDALAGCGAAGVRAAVICAGGFAETGRAGAELQDRAARVARSYGIRLLGPNTSGFAAPPAGVYANFLPAVVDLPPGPAAIVAQSGGMNLALSFLAAAQGLGIRLGVGLGNAADVDAAAVLDHLHGDGETRVVGLHLEGITAGRRLVAALTRLAARVPVVVLKVGRTDVGAFARSHTGALTGDHALARAALAQSGAVVVDDPTEMVDAMRALAAHRLPPRRRPGVGVVTGQAGPGLVVADLLRGRGVELPALAPATAERLAALLPPLTYLANPVDTGRPAASFPEVLGTVAADPAIDAVVVYALDEPGALDPVADLPPLAGGSPAGSGRAIPVLFGTGGPAEVVTATREALARAGIPAYDSPDRLARAAAALVADAAARHRLSRATPEGAVPARRLGPGLVDERRAKELLAAAGVAVPAGRVCADREAAAAALAELGGPVVVKVLDAAVTHKSDVGGVHVGVRDRAGLDRALDAIDRVPGRASSGTDRPARARYLVERQAGPGTELIVGGRRDAAFGPVVILGLGGVTVELGAEPAMRLAPLGPEEAADMVAALPAAVLAGHRGAPPVDIDAVARVVRAVAGILVDHDDVAELEINPLRVTAGGPVALDALIVPARAAAAPG